MKHLEGALECGRARQTPSGAKMFFGQVGCFCDVDVGLLGGFCLF